MSFFQDEHYKIPSKFADIVFHRNDLGSFYYLFTRGEFNEYEREKMQISLCVADDLKNISNYELLPIHSLFYLYVHVKRMSMKIGMMCLICGESITHSHYSENTLKKIMSNHIDRNHNNIRGNNSLNELYNLVRGQFDSGAGILQRHYCNIIGIDDNEYYNTLLKEYSRECHFCGVCYMAVPSYEVVVAHLKKCGGIIN